MNELRDELALEKFGMSYSVSDVYDRNKEDSKTLEKITAVRAVYLQRISEGATTQAPTTTDMGSFAKEASVKWGHLDGIPSRHRVHAVLLHGRTGVADRGREGAFIPRRLSFTRLRRST